MKIQPGTTWKPWKKILCRFFIVFLFLLSVIGKYPHEQPDDPNDLCFDVHPANHTDILQMDKHGNPRHWMLELHFVDRKINIGAFFEQLLKAE